VKKRVFAAFVDLEKAYDRVNRSKLWEVLEEYGVEMGLVRAVKSMYDGSKACVRVNGMLSEWFEVKQGVRQGCVISPWLFNVFMDKCVRTACVDTSGIKVGEADVRMLLYADDVVVLAESEEELQEMLEKLELSTRGMDLKINVSKTKIVIFGEENGECECRLNNERVEIVNEFVYLGRVFEKSGSMDGEINRRVCAGRKVVGTMAKLTRSKCL
jgi:hypothetical protein